VILFREPRSADARKLGTISDGILISGIVRAGIVRAGP
jgi:hypothetical protein